MAMSYKSYMDEIEKRLHAMTIDELRQLILHWAEQKKPEGRRFFLDQLKKPPEDKSSINVDLSVIDAVREFCARISDGEYLDEEEWQDDEFDGVAGDESWVEEMDGFLAEARQQMMNRQYQTAWQIYEPIIAVLEEDWESSLLPGSSGVESMLNENLPEHIALFFHAVYRTAEPNERPHRLYQEITRFEQMSRSFDLTSINEVLKEPLPELDVFLPDWVRYLLEHPFNNSSRLIRNAFKLLDEAALATFARQHADRYPGVFVDWLDRILERDATAEAAVVAREALQAIDPERCVRSQVGDRLARIGKQQNDMTMQLEGCSAAFYSSPGLSRLLSLYEAAWQTGDFAAVSSQAVERLQALLDLPKKPYRSDDDKDLERAWADQLLLAHALLLSGRYQVAMEAAKAFESLGWTYGANPKPILFYFFVAVLTPRDRQQSFITGQWQPVAELSMFRGESINFALYQDMSFRIIEQNPPDEQQKQSLLTWLLQEATARIQAIVGNQHRTSYHKAAMLLAVLVQTYSSLGRQQEGRDLISQIETSYSRYSAFRAEIRKACRLINYAPAKRT
ncbi:MAG: hypothetical protein SCM11_00960 [Bacillota bacterium]|nr:hypothetical protein [Bacillota bacterium]